MSNHSQEEHDRSDGHVCSECILTPQVSDEPQCQLCEGRGYNWKDEHSYKMGEKPNYKSISCGGTGVTPQASDELRRKIQNITFDCFEGNIDHKTAAGFILNWMEKAREQERERLLESVDRFEVIDDTGRAYVKGSIYGTPVSVKLDYQDDGRTLKIFLTDKEQDDDIIR